MSAPADHQNKPPRRRRSPEEVQRSRTEDPLALEKRNAELHQARIRIAATDRNPDARSASNDLTVEPKSAPRSAAPVEPAPIADYAICGTPPISDTQRRSTLQSTASKGPTAGLAAVKPQVIDLILKLEYRSPVSDRALLAIGIAYALWARNRTGDGEFRPDRDLNELMIRDFLKQGKQEVTERTRGTYALQLRRLHRQGAVRQTKFARTPASAPYTYPERSTLWEAANALDTWQGEEARTMLALAFGAGCMSEEIHTMRAHQVDARRGRVVVQIARKHWVRDVPVYGAEARWLLERSREMAPGHFLFRPTVGRRANAISDLVWRLAKHTSAFNDFKIVRARHTWMRDALVAGVPFPAVAQAGGVGAASNLLADLIPYMPDLTPIEIVRAFDSTYAHLQDAS
ncbi:hypothetical protein [Nocardioides sp. GCM10030258]|uniref:hypothetical protein n=1 Tax=unclassified Nocardioides TaxID=2615069 RepID=UPI0036100BF8